ncbi:MULTISPECIES: hypothetical protein [unclassified Pseudoalteromonas]|uniref:hypothetical protein n=1 Tax=unclassified Pseudoalteromonas TaxID=194690 RepID=UPI0025B313A9|nr:MULTISPECIES: hypothetical protein [unclassified Pseudoalteromonas]MDN3380321.1 hypothetical protein [Pseudoalteromonas sp. APC 3893]MDN3388761.1 hypothetical protein [Pseudoalteromonas sp. APC 4017]
MLDQYADIAYRGKLYAKFRDEIATDERDSMYCRYQSKQALYPRGNVFGHCFDSFQDSAYKYNLSGKAEYYRKVLGNDELILNLPTKGSKITDLLVFFG